MSDQRRGPVLPDATPIRRSSSSSQRRPSYSSGSSSRSSQRTSSRSYESSRSSSRRSSDYGRSSDRRYSGNGGNKKKKRRFKSSFYFLAGLAVYALILLILCAIFLGYADRSLKKFEKSQSTYYMDDYVKNFRASLDAGTLPAEYSMGSSSAFEPADKKLQGVLAAANGKELTYEKDGSSYNTEEPIYNILAGDQPIAQIQLEATNARVVFAILTVMDWEIKDAKLLGGETGSDYYINAPEGYSITVNGVPVGSEYKTGKVSDSNKLLVNAKEYVNIPETVEYMIPGLTEEPVVAIRDESGQEVGVSKDGNTYIAGVADGSAGGTMPADLEETALEIAKTWSLFMTDDLSGGNHGLKTVQQYLIPGSAYDEMAKGWAGGIDITFTSAHTLGNPAFKNIAVTNYVRYTEDCFSCHIYFDKPMHLTRTGADIVDTTDSDYVFVKYEGKWCLVDMTASQQSGEQPTE
ncbi:MAG: hypothetical protein IKI20_03215 [Lachnospiraceae bacterium]|nr:hypothetical protein [Lachnospiraceae bacterium]